MRVAALLFATAIIGYSQGTLPIQQQAGNCAQNFVGNNNTGTITCYNVDKKLAEQIAQLITASKHDGKTLKDLSDRLAALLLEVQKASPTITVNSVNQQGGITAAEVTINQGEQPLPPRRISSELKQQLIAFLSEKPGKASVAAVINDPEAFDFAQDWYDLLKAAGWQMEDSVVRSILVTGRPLTGVQIQIHGEPVAPGATVQIPNDTAVGHLARALAAIIDPRDVVANPTLTTEEGYVNLQIMPHPPFNN